MAEEIQKEKMSRSQFLLMGTLGSFVGAVMTIPPFIYALSPSIKVMFQGKSDVPSVWREVSSVFDIPSDRTASFRVDFPQKQSYDAGQPNSEVGSITNAVLVSWRNGKMPERVKGKKRGKLSASEIDALGKKLNVMSNACAHMGCPVRWDPAHHQILCPCHGGIYTINGAHVGGPPPHGLWRYVFDIRDDGMIRIKHEFDQGTPWVV